MCNRLSADTNNPARPATWDCDASNTKGASENEDVTINPDGFEQRSVGMKLQPAGGCHVLLNPPITGTSAAAQSSAAGSERKPYKGKYPDGQAMLTMLQGLPSLKPGGDNCTRQLSVDEVVHSIVNSDAIAEKLRAQFQSGAIDSEGNFELTFNNRVTIEGNESKLLLGPIMKGKVVNEKRIDFESGFSGEKFGVSGDVDYLELDTNGKFIHLAASIPVLFGLSVSKQIQVRD